MILMIALIALAVGCPAQQQSQIAGVNCPALVLHGGASQTCMVTLTAAPSADAAVALSSDIDSITVPASVTVTAGSLTGNFTVNSAAVTEQKVGHLRIVYGNTIRMVILDQQ